ncbi:MAG: nitroreductase [candidate division KSB1 bacterium]|nr:nitroreductase [candidate division KSB1 bacterium]MDZ7294538.1 nitroreductase [candidate division KSB1 bacterium]MDZ7386703.1 nitroreductase [candidate division KSB1 bacterium]
MGSWEARYQRSVVELIRARRSCRTFDGRLLAPEVQQALATWLRDPREGPFGNAVRLGLVELEPGQWFGARWGTYGVIKGAHAFLVGAVQHGPMELEDFGFVFEAAILKATELGVATCWLGGTFARSLFARAVQLGEGELLPAVSPLGYAKVGATLVDAAFRRLAKSATRKPWAELFFSAETGSPLSPEEVGSYALALEMLRLAPSASNRQPWRVWWEPARSSFHMVLHRTKGYRIPGALDLQRVDMGIAMCHFALTAREIGLHGRWVRERVTPGRIPADTEYCATWRASETAPRPGECRNDDSRG